jgi:hypothetical protein
VGIEIAERPAITAVHRFAETRAVEPQAVLGDRSGEDAPAVERNVAWRDAQA